MPNQAVIKTYPVMEQRRDEGFKQLWRFLPSSDNANSMIQSYTLDNEGLVLDTESGDEPNQLIYMNIRKDNDNQKFYVRKRE